MDSNSSFFTFPFVDSDQTELSLIKREECCFDIHNNSSSTLLGDDVLAQFLTGDPLEKPDLNRPTTLHCEICKNKFDNARKYYGHLRVHSKNNLWICDKCPDQKFATKQNLKKHSLIHKPLARVRNCPQCTMAFESSWRLNQHLFAKHLDYRPHKCDQCEKSFHKMSDLKIHKDVHDGTKRFECLTCKRKFTDRSNLKRHMTRHLNEKPYACTGCQNRFTQIASLKRHHKICSLYVNTSVDQTTRKNYCRECGMAFQYKSALLEHCVRQHSNQNTEDASNGPNQINIDANKTVDDILSEDDYMTMSIGTEIYTTFNQHIESFQNGQIFNTNPEDLKITYNDNTKIIFDYTNGGKSVDQDIMNALYQVKPEQLTNELSNLNAFPDKPVDVPQNTLPDESVTIFESDIDLEASTNLAANLTQLIGENSVQYISTEGGDTFIITSNSEIDAERLTDMLIGCKMEINFPSSESVVNKTDEHDYTSECIVPQIIRIDLSGETLPPTAQPTKKINESVKTRVKIKTKKMTLYKYATCN